ncbi:Uncharacterised protein [Vibrio cholerae]|nr:Uncharacterised protein [Vibrio cholerae]
MCFRFGDDRTSIGFRAGSGQSQNRADRCGLFYGVLPGQNIPTIAFIKCCGGHVL